MKILGLNIMHADSSAFLIINGKLICGIDEERIDRIKHSSGFPNNAINFCLDFSKLRIEDIDYVAINSNFLSNLSFKIFFLFKNFMNLKLFDILKKKRLKFFFSSKFKYFPKILKVDHHISHMSSAFFCSPFEEAVNISVDGSGDFVSTAIGYGKNNEIKIIKKVFFPHSLGFFYQAITNFLGFKNYGDEYKVMGMAAYGNPIFAKQLLNIISYDNTNLIKLNLKYFKHQYLDTFNIDNKKIILNQIYDSNLLENLLSIKERKYTDEINQSHFDLACSLQAVYEVVFFNILDFGYKKFNLRNLTLSGGCAMNSLANGKIKKNTKFENIFIQPASGDGGGSLGAALYSSSKFHVIKKNNNFNSLYGRQFSSDECNAAINKYVELKNFRISKLSEHDLNTELSKLIRNSGVVGRFVGRCEWGSRALGNRSILADPSNPDIKNIINQKIKKRESFRPFAPSILHEFGNDWFENYDYVPHMTQVLKIKENKRAIIPAVTHVDGTGRLQSVDKNNNEKFYNLIKKFYDLYKIPLLLNTSFNENEPIVFTPENAIETFLKSKMDALILENYLIVRK